MIEKAFPRLGNINRDLNKVREQTFFLFIPKSSYYFKNIGLLSFIFACMFFSVCHFAFNIFMIYMS